MVGPVNGGVTDLAIAIFWLGHVVEGRNIGVALEAEHHDVWTLQLPRIGGAMGDMAADAASSIGRWVGENLREPLLAVAVDTGPAVGTED